jgi:hypothetical protein
VPIVVAGLTHGHAVLDRQSAGLSLSFFGICFVAARLLFANTINRWGGYRVAIVSLPLECFGLVVLWLAPRAALALAGLH